MSTAPPTQPKAIVAAAAAEPSAPPWLRQVAMVTGVLAALGAFLTVRSTTLSNDAIYRSTQATLLQANETEFRNRQPEKKADAQKYQDERDAQLVHGKQLLNEKDVVGYAGMAGQFAIALASVAALTRRRPAFYAAVLFGLVAFAVTGYAMVAHYLFMKA
jgi:hypothetical protein